MARENELVIKINGDVKGYQDALKKAKKETEDLQKTFNSIAKTGAVAFTAFAGTVFLVANQFDEFEDSLLSVKTLLDESSFSTKSLEKGFQDLGTGALDALSEFPLSLQSINKSLFDIVSASIPAEKAISVLGSTSRLAVAGLTESAIATKAITSALGAFQLSAEESELVAAKFFTTQKFGRTTIAELSQSFGQVATSAFSYGVSLNELLAATSAATVASIDTAQAMTSMKAVLSGIARPTQRAREEAERLGIEFTSTALRSKGLAKFLDELTAAEGFSQQSVEKLFRSVEAQNLIFALTGSQAGLFKKVLDELSDSQKLLTTFTKAYETQSESSKNQTIIFKNNLKALSIVIGSELSPIITGITQSFTKFLQLLKESPGVTSFIAKLLIVGTISAGLITTIGLVGLGFLKLRAAMIAASAASVGFKVAMKSLIGSTGLGFFIVFLPEIVDLLKNSFVPALTAVAIGLFKTRVAMIAAATATQGLRIAIKGLLLTTGIGALLAFLPEIVLLFEKVFGSSTDAVENAAANQKRILLQQTKDEKEILKARLRGLEEEEINFIRRRQDIKRKIRELEKNEDKEARAALLANVKLLNEQLLKDEKKFADKRAKIKTEDVKKGFDRTRQQFIDDNVLLTAQLAGIEKKEVAFLARRQAINIKAREAEGIKDKVNRELALKNIELLNKELIKEQEDLVTKQKEISDTKTADQKKIDDEKDKRDAEKQVKEEERSTKNIQRLSNETEVIKAKLDKQTADEISFLTRKQEIRDEAAEALLIKDDEERASAIKNNDAQKTLLIQQEEKFIIDRTQLKAEQEEKDAELQEELSQLSIEQREALNEEDLQALRDSLQTKADIETEAAKQRLLANRKEKTLFAADEKKFGGTIATINKFFRSENVKNAQKAASELIVLQQSSNSAMKAIGKAAALVQIAIDTQRGAMAAFTALAGIPIVGPGLGAAAAASLVLFGAERAAKVASAQRGGRVEGTGFGDTQPFLLEPNELIVPRQNFEETITAVSNQRAVQSEAEEGTAEVETEGGVNEIIIGFTEEAADFLTVEQNEARALGISEEVR